MSDDKQIPYTDVQINDYVLNLKEDKPNKKFFVWLPSPDLPHKNGWYKKKIAK